MEKMKKINDRQVIDFAKSISSKKMSDYKDLTVGNFFADVIRPLIELMGIEPLQLSIEDEQAVKIQKLEQELKKFEDK